MEQDGKLDREALDEITDKVLAYRPRPPQPKRRRQPRERRLAHRPPPAPKEDDGILPDTEE